MAWGSSLKKGLLKDDVVPSRVQNVTYTCYSLPSIMTEGGRSAAFTYNGDGARVKMNVSDGATSVLARYYIGNQYELDVTSTGTTERLYLGGDAYSAPAVYIKEGSGTWTFYNIGRDYLGNITHIATSDGTLVEENSYDPWGRLRNPETKEIYSLGTEPELMLGRGYTGHEHLTWFGLINMNARLYDPVLGRFLSPDPFVQMPDFTQSFNRYSYCLNNPLVYVDENGEFWHIVAGAIIGGAINFITNFKDFDNFWEGLASVLVGAGAGALSAATGNIALITLGGALNSGVNNVVKQLNPEKQWGDIDWKTVGGQVIWGGSISLVGAGISTGIDKTSWVSELLDIMNINKNFARNVAGSTIKGMMVGGGTGVVAGAFRANVTKDWRDIFGGMLNGMAYGAGAGLASSLITEAGYQLQLKNSKSPAISADMAEVISSNTNDIVRRLDVSYMDYNYWDSSAPSMFKDYIQYFNDIWSSNLSSSPTPNVPSSTVINPVFFPY